ncbi:unnamed protein product [Lactuca virosa]|uniref:AAA+ ATPase domain-containing protein n=1 Tax=Lactuca virosa TaxID=75947 RepID=A0AAU9MRX6_9ASTR|nr:unnamed protein product [Lactuca virosa]
MGENFLRSQCRDLLKEAQRLDHVSGRDHEITTIAGLLSRKSKSNVILIGEPGVGKTAIVEGLAQRILKGDVPKNMKDVQIFSLDIGELLGGTKYRGEFEKKFQKIMTEVQASRGKVVLFIDEIHLALGAGRVEGSNVDVANLLKPYLARGDSRLIGATTSDEYMKYVSIDAAFARRFQQVIVDEPSIPDTINILRGLKKGYEMHHDVRILDAALVAAVQYSNRYITARYLPDKAIDLVDEACSQIKLQLDTPRMK